MPQNGLADRVNQFIKLGVRYFSWANVERLHLSNVTAQRARWVKNPAEAPPAGVLPEGISDAVEAQHRRFGARSELMTLGPLLAQELEHAGHDSTDLLTFLHRIDGGGGPEEAVKGWADLKVSLQRVLLRGGAKAKPTAAGADQSDQPLKASRANAYASWERAIEHNPELKGQSLQAVYAWLKERDPCEHYELPAYFPTWERYIRAAKSQKLGRVNSPRAGRAHGPSIVKAEDR